MTNSICNTTDLDEEVCDCPRHKTVAPTEPGLYRDLPERVYHAPAPNSLSASGARRLLDVAPRQWKWEQDNPTNKSTDYFDLGTAVHTLVLGTGAPLVDVGFDSWQTKAAKTERQKAWDAGKVPLRTQDYDQAHAMAASVLEHPTVAGWLASGEPELSVYHRDPDTGVMRRARADWVHWIDDRHALIDDLKTSPERTPEGFRRSVAKFRYHAQQAWYQDAFAAHGITTAFVFVVVCTEPPYLPYIVELPDRAVERGARINREAIDLYAGCRDSGVWPDHGLGIHQIDLPSWEYAREDYDR